MASHRHRTLACLVLMIAILTSSDNAGLRQAVAKSFIEACNTASQCTSLVGYRSASGHKLQDIAALFNVDTISLLGANNLDLGLADPENLSIAPHQLVKVPVTCSCVNGIWRGNSTIYKVKPGDTLGLIADDFFGKLVTYKQIAQANGLGDPANIPTGTLLVIPFPCACSSAGKVLLSYVVESGDTIGQLLGDYGIGYQDFMALNNMNNGSQLAAGDVVDIPIHACLSTFRRSAVDYGLVVANGTYVITAGHCVQCSCLANLEQVYCTPAPATISGSCPDMRCVGSNLTIGQMITSRFLDGCNVTSCNYSGFKKKVILSSLETVTLNSCPAPPAPPSYRRPSGTMAFPPAMAPSLGGGGTTTGTSGTISSSPTALAPAPSMAAAAAFQPLVSLVVAALLSSVLLVASSWC